MAFSDIFKIKKKKPSKFLSSRLALTFSSFFAAQGQHSLRIMSYKYSQLWTREHWYRTLMLCVSWEKQPIVFTTKVKKEVTAAFRKSLENLAIPEDTFLPRLFRCSLWCFMEQPPFWSLIQKENPHHVLFFGEVQIRDPVQLLLVL